MTAHQPEPDLAPVDWLQCEALRRLEERGGRPSLDDPATRRATRTEGALVERIAVRARLHADGKRLSTAIGRALAGVGWTLALLALLGGLLGALAARALLDDGVVQLSWALLTLLGLPTLMLVVWLLVWAWPKRAARGVPGRALWATIAGLARRFDTSGHGHAVGAALADYGRAGGARIASSATHLFWAGYLVGAIALLAAAFIGLRFDFAWGSTLLGTETLAPVIDGLGRLAALWPGLSAPDDAAIRALLIDRSPPADRGAWAGVLLAALALGGLLPRLVLAAGFLLAHRRQRLALDLSRPGYVALAAVLRPSASKSTGRIGPKPPARLTQRTLPRASPGSGPRIAVGLELETDHATHAELAPDAEWLGAADDRPARRALLEAIGVRRPRPEAIVVLCSMARTPDRGTGAWLAELDAVSPVAIRLVEADVARDRGDDLAARTADWTRLAEEYGLDAPERDD